MNDIQLCWQSDSALGAMFKKYLQQFDSDFDFTQLVGSFQYNIDKQELFAVFKSRLDDEQLLSNYIEHCYAEVSTTKNHIDIWNEGGYAQKYNIQHSHMSPRGRVYYNLKNKSFSLYLGSWANGMLKTIEKQVREQFNISDEIVIKQKKHYQIKTDIRACEP